MLKTAEANPSFCSWGNWGSEQFSSTHKLFKKKGVIGLHPSPQHGCWHRAGAQGTCVELFKWHIELKQKWNWVPNLEALIFQCSSEDVEGPGLPSGSGSSASLQPNLVDKNQLHAPKTSHMDGEATNAIILCHSNLWLHLSKRTGKIVLPSPSTSSSFLFTFFFLLFL